MKKLLFILSLLTVSFGYAQEKRESRGNIEIMGGFLRSENTNAVYNPTISVTYTQDLFRSFGIGLGVQYEQLGYKIGMIGGGLDEKVQALGIYGDIRGYLPTKCQNFEFVGVFNMGADVIVSEISRTFPQAPFMLSPQLGARLYFAKDKKLALNARVFYKYLAGQGKISGNNWGVIVGISF